MDIDKELSAKIQQATIEHLDELVLLFDDYRVWYRKPSDLKTAKAFLKARIENKESVIYITCLLYTSPSPRDRTRSRMPSSA